MVRTSPVNSDGSRDAPLRSSIAGPRDAAQAALAELLQHQPEFSCRLARKRLFYVKDQAHLDIYIEGLRKAGVPE